jgi:protein-S-isoprenylcysteine O-methyltransferase Ste14
MIFGSIVIALVAIAAPLTIHTCAAGRIPINQLVGIRIGSVMSSPEAWRAGHRTSLPSIWIGALVTIVLAAVSFSPALPESTQSALVVAAAIVLVAALVVGSVFANRAALTEFAKQDEHQEHSAS